MKVNFFHIFFVINSLYLFIIHCGRIGKFKNTYMLNNKQKHLKNHMYENVLAYLGKYSFFIVTKITFALDPKTVFKIRPYKMQILCCLKSDKWILSKRFVDSGLQG